MAARSWHKNHQKIFFCKYGLFLRFVERLEAYGSVCRMADNAMEQAIKDGLDPKSCKGQTGTCSKKLHSILDVCSCSIPVFSLQGGTSSERQLIQEALNQGAFKEGDILSVGMKVVPL